MESAKVPREILLIGRTDIVDFPDLQLFNVKAKIDTGANRSAMHCSDIKLLYKEGIQILRFHVPLADSDDHIMHEVKDFFTKKIKSSSGHVEERFVIRTKIVLFDSIFTVSMSLTDRKEMNYPVLLGRKLLAKRFIVDVTKENLSYNQKNEK